MTSSTLLADVVLPAATWYEKHDLNTTDMHPFVHAFTPAIDPPFETRTDFDAFHAIARRFSELARTHLGVRRDVVAVPLQHDTPGETAQPGGRVRDWRTGRVRAGPGQDDAEPRRRRARLRRDRRQDGQHRAAGRPAGHDDQGDHLPPRRGDRVPRGGERGDARRRGRRPARDRHRREDGRGDPDACPATTNGRLAVQGFRRAGAAHRHPAASTSPRAARRSGSPSPTPRPARCR